MAITLSSDYIYVIAMLKTTPLVVSCRPQSNLAARGAGGYRTATPREGSGGTRGSVGVSKLRSYRTGGLEEPASARRDVRSR